MTTPLDNKSPAWKLALAGSMGKHGVFSGVSCDNKLLYRQLEALLV